MNRLENVYDDLGRLKTDDVSGENEVNYTYDDFNNRETMAVENTSLTKYEYDLNNRIVKDMKQVGDVKEIKPIAQGQQQSVSAINLDNSTNEDIPFLIRLKYARNY